MSITLLVQRSVQSLSPDIKDFHRIKCGRTIAAFGSPYNLVMCRCNTHHVRMPAPSRRTQRILMREEVQAKGGEDVRDEYQLQRTKVSLPLYMWCDGRASIVCLGCVCRRQAQGRFEFMPQPNSFNPVVSNLRQRAGRRQRCRQCGTNL